VINASTSFTNTSSGIINLGADGSIYSYRAVNNTGTITTAEARINVLIGILEAKGTIEATAAQISVAAGTPLTIPTGTTLKLSGTTKLTVADRATVTVENSAFITGADSAEIEVQGSGTITGAENFYESNGITEIASPITAGAYEWDTDKWKSDVGAPNTDASLAGTTWEQYDSNNAGGQAVFWLIFTETTVKADTLEGGTLFTDAPYTYSGDTVTIYAPASQGGTWECTVNGNTMTFPGDDPGEIITVTKQETVDDAQVYLVNETTLYAGSGGKVMIKYSDADNTYVEIGAVTANGKLSLTIPSAAKGAKVESLAESVASVTGATATPPDAKMYVLEDLSLFDGNGKQTGYISLVKTDASAFHNIVYVYFDKACTTTSPANVGEITISPITANQGWNKMDITTSLADGSQIYTTAGIPSDLKWVFEETVEVKNKQVVDESGNDVTTLNGSAKVRFDHNEANQKYKSVGTVTNGQLTFTLPSTQEVLGHIATDGATPINFSEPVDGISFTLTPSAAKVYGCNFDVLIDGVGPQGSLKHAKTDGDTEYEVTYFYVDRACTLSSGVLGTITFHRGWNRLYNTQTVSTGTTTTDPTGYPTDLNWVLLSGNNEGATAATTKVPPAASN
jgi:hypothetical protein